MTEKFDTLTAAKGFTQAGFSVGQAESLAGHFAGLHDRMATKKDIATIKSDMATKRDVRVLWGVIFGAVVPLLLLNTGLSVSIAMSLLGK